MRVGPMCLLVACAAEPLVEVDTQRPPPTSELALSVSAVRPGQPATWIVDGLQPGERVLIVRGADVGPGACPPAAAGLCLDVTGPPSVLVRGTADAAGTATITLAVPPTLPLGFDVAFQAVALAGGGRADAAKSNPVARTTRATAPSDLSAADLVITEVMADPAAVTDANGEWFELAALAPVDLNDLKILNQANPDMATVAGLKPLLVANDCLSVAPGDFILFARQADPGVNGGLPAVDHVVGTSLTNTNGGLSIAVGDTLVHTVAWALMQKPGKSTLLDPDGVLDPMNTQADGPPWCYAADGGTPKLANTQCP